MKHESPDGRKVRQHRQGIDTYKQLSDTGSRDEMVKKHLKLVSYIANRLAIGLPDWVDNRDLISAGVIGLIDAVNNFDPGKNIKFETYAKTRIKGAIIDELRSLDWIPRSTRSKSREIERSIEGLVKTLGRFPTDEEIAVDLEWDIDKYYKTLGQVAVTTLLSLDEMIGESSGGTPVKRLDLVADDQDGALDTMTHQELIDTVIYILGELTEQERLVIALYYYEELTLKEIGMVLDVTESRVSQVHTAAILKLRAKLRSAYSGV